MIVSFNFDKFQFSLVYVTKKVVLLIFSNRRIIVSFNYEKILVSV
jgi:hypothetical protein